MTISLRGRIHLALGILALCTGNLAFAASLPPAEDFFKNPAIDQPVLSPRGDFLLFLGRNKDGRQALAVSPSDNLKKAGFIVNDAKLDVIFAQWISESRLIFVTRDTQAENTLSDGNVFAIDRDGSNLLQLISGDWGYKTPQATTLLATRMLKSATAFSDYCLANRMKSSSARTPIQTPTGLRPIFNPTASTRGPCV